MRLRRSCIHFQCAGIFLKRLDSNTAFLHPNFGAKGLDATKRESTPVHMS